MADDIDVKVDGRPRGAHYLNGNSDLMDGFTSTDTSEYGQGGARLVDPAEQNFMEAIGAVEPDTDEPYTDDDEEAVYEDEYGNQYGWDELTEDEQAELYGQELDVEAAEVQEEEIEAGFERLAAAYPALNDQAFIDQFFPVARGVAVALEAAEDDPGLAAELLESSAFLGEVMRQEFGAQPVLHGDDIFITLWQEGQAGRLDWNAT